MPAGVDVRAALTAWADTFRTRIGPSAPDPGFVDLDHAQRFVERGSRLAERLQRELGDDWCVSYHPEPTLPPGVRLRRRG